MTENILDSGWVDEPRWTTLSGKPAQVRRTFNTETGVGTFEMKREIPVLTEEKYRKAFEWVMSHD